MRTTAILLLVTSLGVLAWDLTRQGAGGGGESLAALQTKLLLPDPAARAEAIRELAKQPGPLQTRLVLSAAGDADEGVRLALEQALVGMTDPEAREWLAKEGLRFPDRWVRYYSALGLAFCRGREAIPLLLPELRENWWEVRWGIVQAIDRVADASTPDQPEVREALLPLLAPGTPPRLRLAALQLLAKGTGQALVDALLEVARKADPVEDGAFLAAAEDALGLLRKGTDALAVRAEQADAPAPLRSLALRALGRAGTEANLPALLAILQKDPSEDLRVDALWSATSLGGKGLAEALLPILRTGSDRLRREAAGALATRLAPLSDDAFRDLSALAKEKKNDHAVAALEFAADLKAPPPPLASEPWEQDAGIEAALSWLVRNQEPDGRWSSSRGNPWHGRIGFPQLFPPDADLYYDTAVTGWVVLAFVASGSDLDKGPHRAAVRRGVAWLLSLQKPNGLFKAEREMPAPKAPNPNYPRQVQYAWGMNHLVPALAVVECLQHNVKNATDPFVAPENRPALDPKLRAAAALALDAIKDGGLPDEYDLFNKKTVDISKLCLVAMCRYASAKLGAPARETTKLGDAALKRAADLLSELVQSGTTIKVPFDFDGHYWFRSHAANCQGIISAVLLSQKSVAGVPIDNFIDPRLATVRHHPPTWNAFYEIVGPAGHPPVEETAGASDTPPTQASALASLSAPWKDDIVNFEYWFHATFATFLLGEEEWYEWEAQIRRVLLAHQRRAGENFGSWDPADPGSRVFGRAYSTALATLSLSLSRKSLSFSQVEWKRYVAPRRPVGNKPPAAGDGKK
ncbi:MAG: HEAT repeat domain-containing protein [Planctomycetes bacterium]|nr:HEAT repeat domain-containing protein [Planctomycetota bacterium]